MKKLFAFKIVLGSIFCSLMVFILSGCEKEQDCPIKIYFDKFEKEGNGVYLDGQIYSNIQFTDDDIVEFLTSNDICFHTVRHMGWYRDESGCYILQHTCGEHIGGCDIPSNNYFIHQQDGTFIFYVSTSLIFKGTYSVKEGKIEYRFPKEYTLNNVETVEVYNILTFDNEKMVTDRSFGDNSFLRELFTTYPTASLLF